MDVAELRSQALEDLGDCWTTVAEVPQLAALLDVAEAARGAIQYRKDEDGLTWVAANPGGIRALHAALARLDFGDTPNCANGGTTCKDCSDGCRNDALGCSC